MPQPSHSSVGVPQINIVHSTTFRRIQANLHIAVSMDPSNELFRPRCESNPALFNRCSVQWLEAWSAKGMAYIPDIRMQEMFNSSKVRTATSMYRHLMVLELLTPD